jgi:hypothetical protein
VGHGQIYIFDFAEATTKTLKLLKSRVYGGRD